VIVDPHVEDNSRQGASPPLKGARETTKSVALLLLLSAVYGVQYLNQILIGLLAQPIKRELSLSDTQIGLLTGLSFSLFYVVLGFPLARLADRRNRKLIVIASVVLFSAATIACGMAAGFTSLFVARICLAVGEAGTMPSAVSMLADRFKPSSRRLAMAFHSSGGFLGTASGMLALSLFSATASWRAIFWSAGAAGLVLAVLIAFFGHEPARQHRPSATRNFLSDISVLARNTTYVSIALGLGVSTLASAAAINWVPSFLARSYGLAQPKIILFLALAWGLGATLGSIAFGYLTNWMNRRGGHRTLTALSILTLAYPLVFLLAFSTGALPLSLAGIVAAFFVMAGVRGPAFAAVQDIVPNELQATATAGLMFSMYAIGLPLGPLLTGMVSDALRISAGSNALRYALSVTMVVGGVGAATLFALGAMKLRANKALSTPMAEATTLRLDHAESASESRPL
jgi:MFS transporter, Spinster family, sphingosine-1-phosphate transporter